MGKVGYFEIQVDDFKRAQNFYGEVFMWKFTKMDSPFDYYLIDTGHSGAEAINGGMLLREQPLADTNGVSGYVCAIYVKSIDETVEALEAHGGTVTVPKMHMPGIGHIAYALDSEGNAIGLYQAE